MDAIARSLNLALALDQGAVVAHFHECTGSDFRPVQTKGDLIIAIVRIRHGKREMIEDAFVQTMKYRQPVRGG